MTNENSRDPRKAVVVASFGTTHADALAEGIAPCEDAVRRAFPDRVLRRAFTSAGVARKLRERDGVTVDTPAGAARRLFDEGCSDLLVLPLVVIPGEEFHEKIVKPLLPLRGLFGRFALAAPLLSSTEDCRNVLAALRPFVPRDGGLLLMGHGSDHPANAAYGFLQTLAENEGMPVYVATVEGYPELTHAVRRIRKDGIRKISLMPLMIVAGDHAKNDMAGDGEDSWKNALVREGFDVTVLLRGIGGLEEIRNIFIRHLSGAAERGPE
jgi:sirohydrochlorin cobaltochelatase